MAAMLDNSLRRWWIFSFVDSNLLQRIKFAVIFGKDGNEGLFVTKDDLVFGIGRNLCGCLGLGYDVPALEPTTVESLSQRKVCKIASGIGPHVLAATEDGSLFTWGSDDYGQLGCRESESFTTPAPCQYLQEHKVKDVACGAHHSLAMTSGGTVFAWGRNDFGQVCDGINRQEQPQQVQGELATHKVVAIACAQNTSFALSDAGEVFSWGSNEHGLLGNGDKTVRVAAKYNVITALGRVECLNERFIKRIVCGRTHVVVLTKNGRMFAWGDNSLGQLGIGSYSKMSSVTPLNIKVESERFCDIGATHLSTTSAAVSLSGKVFAWGSIKGLAVCSPIMTNFRTMNDAFAALSTPAVTCQPLVLSEETGTTLYDNLKACFDDEETSDVAFNVEDRLIHVHKSFLKMRCQYFRTMFKSSWTEKEQGAITVQTYSYTVYRAFLLFLYTDVVEVSGEDAISLLDLAEAYCETSLKRLCEEIIRKDISIQNVFTLYSLSVKYSAEFLRHHCLHFALSQLNAVMQTEAFTQLDVQVLKAFLTEAAKEGIFLS